MISGDVELFAQHPIEQRTREETSGKRGLSGSLARGVAKSQLPGLGRGQDGRRDIICGVAGGHRCIEGCLVPGECLAISRNRTIALR